MPFSQVPPLFVIDRPFHNNTTQPHECKWYSITYFYVCHDSLLIHKSYPGSWVPTCCQGLVLPQLSSAFFGFFVTENAVIDVMVWEMVTNIAPRHTFQIFLKISKYMQPILKYLKNNMWLFWMAPKAMQQLNWLMWSTSGPILSAQ